MPDFPVHTLATAPHDSVGPLAELQQSIGMIPNLAASMAESPELLKGFLAVRSILERGTFRQDEIQVLALANAFENGCRYCMALHSTLALKMGVPAADVAELREGRDPATPKLRALSAFSRQLVRRRGDAPTELASFLAAGYTRRQALEVVLQIAGSIIPNFAHHLTKCPVDDAFIAQQWSPGAVREAAA